LRNHFYDAATLTNQKQGMQTYLTRTTARPARKMSRDEHHILYATSLLELLLEPWEEVYMQRSLLSHRSPRARPCLKFRTPVFGEVVLL
jgi:hypothetical protein